MKSPGFFQVSAVIARQQLRGVARRGAARRGEALNPGCNDQTFLMRREHRLAAALMTQTNSGVKQMNPPDAHKRGSAGKSLCSSIGQGDFQQNDLLFFMWPRTDTKITINWIIGLNILSSIRDGDAANLSLSLVKLGITVNVFIPTTLKSKVFFSPLL